MTLLYLCTFQNTAYKQLLQHQDLKQVEITNDISQAEIILADPPKLAPLVNEAVKLQWVQSTYAGCDTLLAEAKRNYQLTNVRGIFSDHMREYVFAQLITFTRHLAIYREAQAQKHWRGLPYQTLRNRCIVIVGTGSIGRAIAETAKHFGMNTIGINRSGKSAPFFDAIYTTAELSQAISTADIIVSVLPSTEETNFLFNQKTLEYCRDSLFINIGRGNVLDESALIPALEKKHLSHAILDVCQIEPLPSDSSLWLHPQITITPHISGISDIESVFDIFRQNLERYQRGQPLKYLVDFKMGY